MIYSAYGAMHHDEKSLFISFSLINVFLFFVYFLSKGNGFLKNAPLILEIVVVAYFSIDIDMHPAIVVASILILFILFTINMLEGSDFKGDNENNSSYTSGYGMNYKKNNSSNFYNPNDTINPSTTGLGHRGVNGIPNQFNINNR